MLTEAVNNRDNGRRVRRKVLLVLCGCIGVGAFLAFFFFAPVIHMNIIPCLIHREGYVSPSYYLFNVGEGYFSYSGHFAWLTENYSNCI